MGKRLLISFVALLFVAGLTLAADKHQKEGSWTGWVTDTHCGAKGESAKHADCAKKCVEGHQAKYALYNPADKKVYVLDPQDKAAGHAGHHVKVTGTVEGDTIKVKAIEMTGEQKGQDKK
jgi:hypothetical protein